MTKEARIYNGKKTDISVSGAGKTGMLYVNKWLRTRSNAKHKNKLKMD